MPTRRYSVRQIVTPLRECPPRPMRSSFHPGSRRSGLADGGRNGQVADRRSTARTVDGHHCAPPCAVGTWSALSPRAI